MTEIRDLTALELAAVIRRREVSPTEVLEHALARAESVGRQVGAFVTLAPDLARDQARAAEKAVLDGGDLPPLLGVPCPVKDLTRVAGVRFGSGSAAFADTVATVDDGVATLLREAGTVMVGKTTTPEFGLPCYTEPDVAPPARTPWDLTRSAGGSSGGAAAAVAGGIVPVAHGSDGGGSIRIPASVCGLVGLKPTRSADPGRSRHGRAARRAREALARRPACPGRPEDELSGRLRERYWAVAGRRSGGSGHRRGRAD